MPGNVASSSQPTSFPITNPQDNSQITNALEPTSFSSLPHLRTDLPFPCEWRSEISSAMEWSLRFLDFSNVPPVDLPFMDGSNEQ